MNISRLAVDLAKDVFQLYGVDGHKKGVLGVERSLARRLRNCLPVKL